MELCHLLLNAQVLCYTNKFLTATSAFLGKIFIGGLSYGTDDAKLRTYFAVYGAVQDVRPLIYHVCYCYP